MKAVHYTKSDTKGEGSWQMKRGLLDGAIDRHVKVWDIA